MLTSWKPPTINEDKRSSLFLWSQIDTTLELIWDAAVFGRRRRCCTLGYVGYDEMEWFQQGRRLLVLFLNADYANALIGT